MSWNYRIMACPHPTKGWEEVYLTINDVYYDRDGLPTSYGELDVPPTYRRGESVSGDDVKEIMFVLNLMRAATKKSILCAGDRWPQEYKPVQNGNS